MTALVRSMQLGLICLALLAWPMQGACEETTISPEKLSEIAALLDRPTNEVVKLDLMNIQIESEPVRQLFRNGLKTENTRKTTRFLLFRLAYSGDRDEDRRAATALLVEYLQIRPLSAYSTAYGLVRCPANAFSPEAKATLVADFEKFLRGDLDDPHYARELIRLAGTAQLDALEPDLRHLVQSYPPVTEKGSINRASPGFNALLALARLGHADAARQSIELVEAYPSSDVRVSVFFPDLGYTRHPAVVEYLWTYLTSAEATSPVGRDVAHVPYWAAAAQALSDMLEGTPRRMRSTQAEWLAWMEAHKDNWPLKR